MGQQEELVNIGEIDNAEEGISTGLILGNNGIVSIETSDPPIEAPYVKEEIQEIENVTESKSIVPAIENKQSRLQQENSNLNVALFHKEDKIIQKKEDIVYNTYGDLHSTPELSIALDDALNFNLSPKDIKEKWHPYMSDDFIIKSLEERVPYGWIYEDGTKIIYNLSDFIDKMPHGIVDKKVTGIGATTLEIESERNSIIVLPTRILAYGKAIKHPKTLYVGGAFKGRNSPTFEEINKYLGDENIKYKKILVVADSLEKLLTEHFELFSYFLMVDEIDILQSDSNYRPNLGKVMDIYFKFSPKDRCLVTATMNDFSNPDLKFECRFDMSWCFQVRRKIRLIHDNNIDGCVIETIKNHPQEKIFIAYNSISHILNIISCLDESLKGECSILCSSQSKVEAGNYYSEELNDNKLPKRITFATCCYFTGIDIEDSYHLITVSNIKRSYAALSVNRMNQIYGRCRTGYGILSDTIIYNSLDLKETFEYYNSYPKYLIKKATKVIELLDTANSIEAKDVELMDLFSIIKEAIQSKTVEKSYGESVELVRKNINNKYIPAYLNIDYLAEKKKMYLELYSNPEKLKEALIKQGHKVILCSQDTKKTEQQIEVEEDSKDIKSRLQHKSYEKVIDAILKWSSSDSLEFHLNYIGNEWNKLEKGLLLRFKELYRYADIGSTLKCIAELEGKNSKAYKVMHNAFIYWALDDKHPFKADINMSFKKGEKYSPEDIEQILIPIIKYHLHKKLSQRSYILFFNTVFATKRVKEKGKNKYTIEGNNPYGLEKQGERIPRDENNLLKYFNL